MSDDTLLGRLRTGASDVRDRVARLGPGQDDDPSPQARDEKPIAASREEFTEEPDPEELETWRDEYYENPLIRQPVRNFAADVLEPGVNVTVSDPDDAAGTTDEVDVPTTSSDHPNPDLQDRPLDEALRAWLGACVISGDSFDGDVATLLEQVVIDLRGRRGSALVEHVYDDAAERERLMGLRAFKPETTTAYTREGKAILLRADDDPGSFDTKAIRSITDFREDAAPETVAGKTAAFVQFDDVFSAYDERDDIPFSLEDVTFITNDPDTGAVFGTPDAASVVEQARDIREEFGDVAQALKGTAYGHWLIQVDTSDKDEAEALANGIKPDQPETLNVVNYGVEEVEEVFGDYPSGVTDSIQQQIEYVLAALPTPLYRVGFAGDINRDVTGEQQEDYRDEVRRERNRLEAAFDQALQMKARELLAPAAGPHADTEVPVNVGIEIRPEEHESPLRDEEFDADEFASVAQGLKAMAPGGAVEQLVSPEEVRELFLGLDAEAPTSTAPLEEQLDESDDGVAEAFANMTDTATDEAALATQYSEGDVVKSPQGLGVVSEVRTEDFTGKNGETVSASSSSPTYVVALKDERVGVGFYTASQLSADEMPDTGVDDPEAALAATADLAAATTPATATADEIDAALESTFDYPESWVESDTPSRLILLDAWSSMGGQFDCGGACCMGELKSQRLCASMKDRVLQWEGWRK